MVMYLWEMGENKHNDSAEEMLRYYVLLGKKILT